MWRARAILGVAIAASLLVISGAIVASASLAPATHASAEARDHWNEGPTYNVTFTESGLPAGTNWSVQVAGAWAGGEWGQWFNHYFVTQFSTWSSLNVSLPNGTYYYRASTPPGFVTTDGQGFFNVSGASPAAVPIDFTALVTYSVTFSETGLPVGTNWTVAVSGGWGGWGGWGHREFLVGTSNSSTLTFNLPNGTYRFHVFEVEGYVANGSGGWFIVNGSSPATITVAFNPLVTYTVTFNESGLPAGTNWSVRVFGIDTAGAGFVRAVGNSTTTVIAFNLPNGTYFYSIERIPGWNVTGGEPCGMFTVNGTSPPEISVVFSQGTET
jgi:hypothetical protein